MSANGAQPAKARTMTSDTAPKSVAYVTVDVFTDERFAGNQLAVMSDARGLSDRQMQAIATEFGYSEATFVLPPRDPANTAEVRIFTPTTEIPFAGHPNVGTAFVLGGQRKSSAARPVKSCGSRKRPALSRPHCCGKAV